MSLIRKNQNSSIKTDYSSTFKNDYQNVSDTKQTSMHEPPKPAAIMHRNNTNMSSSVSQNRACFESGMSNHLLFQNKHAAGDRGTRSLTKDLQKTTVRLGDSNTHNKDTTMSDFFQPYETQKRVDLKAIATDWMTSDVPTGDRSKNTMSFNDTMYSSSFPAHKCPVPEKAASKHYSRGNQLGNSDDKLINFETSNQSYFPKHEINHTPIQRGTAAMARSKSSVPTGDHLHSSLNNNRNMKRYAYNMADSYPEYDRNDLLSGPRARQGLSLKFWRFFLDKY